MQTSRPHTERTETEAPRSAHGRSGDRRGTSGSGAAVPPPLTADALRAAQRGAGNAAVTGMIARRARTTEAPEQPGTEVHDILRSAGKPLAGPLRAEMESRFDTDFSAVRLHTGPAAARSARSIGARAYTSGSHVVLGDGGGDKHTLAHELTHVVQQRQGPVAGTDHGNGLRVSDPSDRFEREAEANAHRIMAGPAPVQRAEAGPAAGAGAALPDTAVIQRKVGFEFEVTDTTWRFYETDENGGKHLKKDTKSSLIDLPGGLSYVAADNGNVEFVTRPLTTLENVRDALREIIVFHDQLTAKKKHIQDPYRIEAAGPGKAKPQATFGIRMQNINELVDTLARLDPTQEPQGTRRRARTDDGSASEREFKERVIGVVPGLGEARTHAGQIFDRLAGAPAEPVDPALRNEVSGYLTVILKTLYDVEEKKAPREDAKYFFSMMPRTDFVSMRDSLSSEASGWLTGRLQDLYTAMNDIVPNGIEGPVFRGKYKEKPPAPALTRREWLDSVFQGATDSKDLLSPPPGYPRHNETPEPEGVGAMGTDNERLTLFELRDLGGPLEKERWPGLAEFIAKLVGKATDDSRLQEKKQ